MVHLSPTVFMSTNDRHNGPAGRAKGRQEGNSMKRVLEEYDIKKLVEARNLVKYVYEYYWGAPGYSGKVKRLETILRKINELLTLEH